MFVSASPHSGIHDYTRLTLILALCVFSFPCVLQLARVEAKEIRATDNYCQEINNPESGNEVVFEPGEYKGPCKILRGGKPGNPLIIRALDSSNPPRIHYDGRHGNVFDVYADNIIIRGLEFGPTRGEVDGIRIFSGDDIVVEDCRFSDTGGIAIVANHSSVRRLTVRRNKIRNSRSTAMYFGCHDGSSCIISNLLVENNFISGVNAADSQIGYGIQVKLNSFGIVRDNVINDIKGPGIMVYGARNSSSMTLIERNFASGSRTSSGIVVGGGPAKVSNNIVVLNHEGGISVEDHAKRGLLRKIVIAHNTAYNNKKSGILVHAEGAVEAIIANNAIASSKEMSAIVASHSGIRNFGNADCTMVSCFVSPEENNFTPLNNTLLFATKKTNLISTPVDDYFGRQRSAAPVIGAIEPPGGVIKMEIKQ